MQIKLTAKLDRPGGTVILCGSCKADAWAEVDRQEGCVLLAPGYRLGEGAVWRLTRHAGKKLRGSEPWQGRPALRQRVMRDGRRGEEIRSRVPPDTLPSLLACPWCDRLQWLRSETLGLPASPGEAEREANRRNMLAAFGGSQPVGAIPKKVLDKVRKVD